jgi:hypothetical protein
MVLDGNGIATITQRGEHHSLHHQVTAGWDGECHWVCCDRWEPRFESWLDSLNHQEEWFV